MNTVGPVSIHHDTKELKAWQGEAAELEVAASFC